MNKLIVTTCLVGTSISIAATIYYYRRALRAEELISLSHIGTTVVRSEGEGADTRAAGAVSASDGEVSKEYSESRNAAAQAQFVIASRNQQIAIERDEDERDIRGSEVMREASLEHARSSLPLYFAPLFAQLDLTPEQRQRMQRILTQKLEALLRISAARYQSGKWINDPAYNAAFEHTTAQFDQQLGLEFGDDILRQYQRFEASAPSRNLTESLHGAVASSGNALSKEQMEKVSQVLQGVLKSDSRALTPMPRGWMEFQSIEPGYDKKVSWWDVDFDAAQAQLRPILSEEQLRALQLLREEEGARRNYNTLLRRAQLQLQRTRREEAASSSSINPPRGP